MSTGSTYLSAQEKNRVAWKAAFDANSELCSRLLDADVCSDDDFKRMAKLGVPVLMCIAMNPVMWRRYLDNDLLHLLDGLGRSILHYAAWAEPALIRALLQHDLVDDAYGQDAEGCTPLYYTIVSNSVDCNGVAHAVPRSESDVNVVFDAMLTLSQRYNSRIFSREVNLMIEFELSGPLVHVPQMYPLMAMPRTYVTLAEVVVRVGTAHMLECVLQHAPKTLLVASTEEVMWYPERTCRVLELCADVDLDICYTEDRSGTLTAHGMRLVEMLTVIARMGKDLEFDERTLAPPETNFVEHQSAPLLMNILANARFLPGIKVLVEHGWTLDATKTKGVDEFVGQSTARTILCEMEADFSLVFDETVQKLAHDFAAAIIFSKAQISSWCSSALPPLVFLQQIREVLDMCPALDSCTGAVRKYYDRRDLEKRARDMTEVSAEPQ